MNRIKEVLERKGIKQVWLAEKLGKSYNMVNSYVQNRQQPRLEILNQIANLLDVDIKDLIQSSKNMNAKVKEIFVGNSSQINTSTKELTEKYSIKNKQIIRTVFTRHGEEIESKMRLIDRKGNEEIADMFDRSWLLSKKQPERLFERGVVKVVDLFAGCGGLSVGAEEACRALGLVHQTVLANDIDDKILQIYKINFPKAETLAVPIEDLFDGACGMPLSNNEEKIKKKLGKIDLLIGGPPCQGNSDLNNHTRREDPKNELYLKMARFCEVIRPKNVIIENVPGVLHDKGQVAQRTWQILKNLGYKISTGVVNCLDIGVPQNRKRSITLGSLEIEPNVHQCVEDFRVNPRNLFWSISDLENINTEDIVFDTSPKYSEENIKRIGYLFDNQIYDLPNSERPDCHRLKKHSYNSVYGRLRMDKYAPTITTGFGTPGRGRFIHPTKRRTITPHEAARIQFFPDFYNFNSNNRVLIQTVIGNAVPPKLGYILTMHLLK